MGQGGVDHADVVVYVIFTYLYHALPTKKQRVDKVYRLDRVRRFFFSWKVPRVLPSFLSSSRQGSALKRPRDEEQVGRLGILTLSPGNCQQGLLESPRGRRASTCYCGVVVLASGGSWGGASYAGLLVVTCYSKS